MANDRLLGPKPDIERIIETLTADYQPLVVVNKPDCRIRAHPDPRNN